MTHDSEIKKVLIVGAGMGGLMLGILLTHSGIDFDIYERTAVIKPIDLEDALKISFPCRGLNIFDNNLQIMGGFGLSEYKNRTDTT
ncbi:hypothetical protein BGZ82_010294 [Podila clonocystis]|nr:hypothetical protein BGZ82_010294 [Podila clonocystis]